ncbi:MAG: threonine/serine exporter family protein [Oscillospiraceae bacterium]|nr:threonine/serine exporter family protein [Oscillospiraceae bacterium]
MERFLPCLYAYGACFFFCIIINFRGKIKWFAPLGSSLGWLTYLLFNFVQNDLLQYFIATVVLSIYAEIMARVFKVPVTGFLLVALYPLVPGGGIYYTMEYCILGETAKFMETGLHTFGIALALAVGILFVSSLVRLYTTIKSHSLSKKIKS